SVTDLAASGRQGIFHSRRSFRVHGPGDQSRVFKIAEPCGDRRRAPVAEPTTKLAEADGTSVGDETQQAERVAATDELGKWRRGTQAITVGERRPAPAGGLGHTAPRHSVPPRWQSQ